MPSKHAPFDIPREITIRGKRWLVAYDRELGDDPHDARSRMELNRTGHLSATTYPEGHPHIRREIHLSSYSNREPRKACETLLHELIHACSRQLIPMAMEEKLVEDVDTPLLRALEQLDWRKP